MNYAVDRWAAAKAAFMAALDTAIAARAAAATRIEAACGQKMGYELESMIGDGQHFEVLSGGKMNYCGYKRHPALVDPTWRAFVTPGHWFITRSQLETETEALTHWATPEAWEAAWAKVQQ